MNNLDEDLRNQRFRERPNKGSGILHGYARIREAKYPLGGDHRWLSVVSPEGAAGVELVRHAKLFRSWAPSGSKAIR